MTAIRTVKFDDLLSFRFLSRPLFSPDGRNAAYLVTQANYEKDGYDSNLWLCGLDNGTTRQLTFSNEERAFSWSRDGASLYFISARGGADKKSSAVYRLPLDGGEARRVGIIHQPVSALWELPDGKILVKTVYAPEELNPENAKYSVYTQVPFCQNGRGFTGQKRAALALWSPGTGGLKRLTGELMNVALCVLSSDGSKALLLADDYADVKPLTNGVYELNLESGACSCLSEGLEYSFKAAGWCGARVLVVASDMKHRGLNENPTVYELRGGKMACLAPQLDTSFHNSIVSDCRYRLEPQMGVMDESGVTYISTEGTSSALHVCSPDGADRCVTPGFSSVDCFDVRGGRAVFAGSRGMGLQELYIAGGGEVRQLTCHNDAALAGLRLTAPVHATVDNGEGDSLDFWYIRPADCESGKKYPTILDIHGGPKATFGGGYFHEAQCWSALGYAVIFTNPRGSDGRGDAFSDIRGGYGQGDYRDIMKVVDWAAKNLDFIDPDRMGVTGGSYGGYMTNWIVTHTDRFKCAASQRGICNWISFDGVSDIGYYFGPDQQGGSSPLTDPAAAWDASPLKYAANVKTPTLFIHSEEDYRCPAEQAFQMFTALRVRGVEARLCYFSGENHELSRSGKPRSRLARLREITAWMDRFLKK